MIKPYPSRREVVQVNGRKECFVTTTPDKSRSCLYDKIIPLAIEFSALFFESHNSSVSAVEVLPLTSYTPLVGGQNEWWFQVSWKRHFLLVRCTY